MAMESRLALCLSAPLDMNSIFAINSRYAISRRSRGMTDLTYRLDDFGRRLDVLEHELAELRALARPEMKPEPAPVAPPAPTPSPPVGAPIRPKPALPPRRPVQPRREID